ncbi:aspartate/glutamate racemase family protein [Streptomyces roseolus]|uniref:aspartate/glutamate racemase family protein n=1 Tax=Streptomyces roseolus TaxID=67358 RepID=UPI001675C425|nr:aspartate/glutamate racemase family protein [Streptomyces roseolus]GGR56089.1 hydantoin racemase [Streptomyces roseolus]
MALVALVNPNTDRATTATMAAIARRTLRPEDGYEVRGVTVAAGPPMLVDEELLRASVRHVLDAADALLAAPEGPEVAALVVGAFGDPGVEDLRARTTVPVIGIAEAALREAGADGRRFGIATTTPGLAAAIDARTARLGWSAQYTGVRLTPGDPHRLAADPAEMTERLADAVDRCVREDGAEAVVIGGGPLGEAAEALRHRFPVPVVGPVPAASREVRRLLEGTG